MHCTGFACGVLGGNASTVSSTVFDGVTETSSRRHSRRHTLYYVLNSVFSTLNATVLVFLLVLYVGIYMKRKVDFTLWLTIFCSVLLLDALTSNPIIQWAFGFHPSGLGPFAMLPTIFASAALAILLYLTLTY